MVLLIARGEKEEARLIEPETFSDYVACYHTKGEFLGKQAYHTIIELLNYFKSG